MAALKDLNKREFLILAILAILVLAMGIYPEPLTDMTNATVTQLLSHLGQSKIPTTLPTGL